MARKKKPAAAVPVKGGKRPVAEAAVSSEKKPFVGAQPLDESEQCLSWRLGLLDLDGPWSWMKIDGAVVPEVLRKLSELERSTWGQLQGNSHHRVEAAGICRDAQKRLEALKQDDVSHLYSLRLSGKQRVWGVLHGTAFYVLWWDPEHEVWPSQKRRT